MESGAFLASLDQFMLSPLVTWVKTFIPADEGIHLDFSDLLDGVILNMIMAEINPSAAPQGVNKVCRDSVQRIQNLNVLVQQIRSYYLDNLRQLIMIPLPDVLLVGRTPYCEQTLEEMKKLLLLLLGCTVQCEKKEEYIERIQMLDFDTKAAIAAHIQELTHSQENVLDLQWLESSGVHPEEMETVVRNVATHLRHVLDQRDRHLETIVELMQEKDGAVSLLSSPSSLQSASYSPSMQQPQKQQTGTQQHLAVELADSKAKIRRLRQELEEKSEQILDCRHELENMEAELKRIQQENYQLQADARAARTYRDELDALRERAIKADKLESEVGRYKEQLHKMEFYKAKVEELKEDNRVLQETKEVLEDQLEGWRSRTDKIHQLEKHNLLLKARVYDMEQEKEADVKRIKELQEENLALCLAQRRSMEESQHLGWELEQLSKTTENSHGLQTLSEEVSERTQSQILKLEKENQRLLRTIEELRAAALNTCRKTQHTHHLVRSSNHFTSSAEQSLVKTTSCSATENHPDAQTLQITNGDSVCQQQLITEELEGVQTQILLADHPDCQMQENGHLQEQDKEMMSGLEILENNHNQLHCFVGPCALGSQSKSPHHDNICASLPTRSPYTSKHTQRLEVKCRGLDTLNQQLQTSLYSTERKAQRLEAEVQELESENQTLQASLEELRISLRCLEQLETGKQNLEHETTMLERDKRQLEKENRRLRQQAEIQEANLDSRNVCMASLEREMRLLVKEMEGLRETSERVKSFERENRELTKQAAIDQKTLATLREELVSEKLKTQQRDNDLEKLSHELEMKVLKQESTQLEAPDSRIKILESELESSLKKSLEIKDDKMVALEAHLQESSVLTQRLWQDLKTVKLSYEALQQQQEEEWTASSSSPPVQPNKTMTECLRESQEATRELLRLQDRLIEVERNNATLEAERQAAQIQLKQLECQSDSQQAQVLALQRQAASLQESNTALQTHNANLQVEKSTLNSQSASLMAQNAHLQQQQSGIESERDSAVQEREELRGAHEQLLRDYERLTVLHERQAMEYEALMGKHACLKNVHRTLELENRTLQDRYNHLLQQRAKLEDLEKTLKEEQMRISLEKEKHQTTAAECCRLRNEKDWLNRTYNQLLSNNEALTADHKLLKSQLNEANLKHTWLEADFSKLKKEYQELDISSTKLSNQCELLNQLKGNLEEENRHLISQIETLMLQNRTLLEQNMESKDLFHVEERQYIDKLNDLRRQKEKLEEKIMDQYRFYEPSPPRRRGNWLTLKLKKLMKSSSRENEPETTNVAAAEPQLCSHDNGSFISSDGSGGSASTSAGDFTSQHRSSTPLKKFPRLKNRLKDRDKVKSIFRRSLSLSSLSHPSTSFEAKQDTDVDECQEDLLTSSLSISVSSILQHPHHSTTPPSGHFNNNTTDTGPRVSELWLTDKDSNGSTVPSGCDDSDGLQNHGMNVVQCGLLSESSGELSLSLENEPWSNGSSPVQQPPSYNSSSSYQPPSDTSSPQPHTNLQEHMEKASTVLTPSSLNSDIVQRQKDLVLSQDFWLTRGTKTIRRGSRTKISRRSSDSGSTDKINSELNRVSSKDETAQASACSPITVLYVQGKSSSMSGCLNCFSTRLVKEGQLGEFRSPKSLPRASSVISSAEGSSRRSSVTSECRRTVQTEPAQTTEKNCTQEQTQCQRQEQNPDTRNSQPGPIPPVKPPRDPTVIVPTEHHTFTLQDPSLGSSFTFNSVFSDTIFSDSEPTTTTLFDTVDMSTNLLYPNSSAEQNAPPERKETAEKTPQALLSSENEQSGKTENAKGLDGKDRLLTGT